MCILCQTTHIVTSPIWKKSKIFFWKFFQKIFKNIFQKLSYGSQMKIYDVWKKKFFLKFFLFNIVTFFQMHKVRMCVVWHKIKIHATKCPYPRNVQIPFLWPKCLYYCHINHSKYTKIKRNTLYGLSSGLEIASNLHRFL